MGKNARRRRAQREIERPRGEDPFAELDAAVARGELHGICDQTVSGSRFLLGGFVPVILCAHADGQGVTSMIELDSYADLLPEERDALKQELDERIGQAQADETLNQIADELRRELGPPAN